MKKNFVIGAFFLAYSFERICEAYSRYKIALLLGYDMQLHADDDIGVHIRSGDCFPSKEGMPVHKGYYQPPLSYYTTAIKHHLNKKPSAKIHIIFEDFGNPVIKYLINYCTAHNFCYRTQQCSFHYDFSMLLSLKTVVFSRGTVWYAVLGLSENLEHMYLFRFGEELGDFFKSNNVDIYNVFDTDGDYLAKMWPWQSSPEQLKLMCSFSADKLTLTRLEPKKDDS